MRKLLLAGSSLSYNSSKACLLALDTDALEELLKGIISKRLTDVKIISVGVERDVDSDGDDILNVTVVFDAESDLDAARVVGLVRHMRPHLHKRGENGFPIISFISEKEAGCL